MSDGPIDRPRDSNPFRFVGLGLAVLVWLLLFFVYRTTPHPSTQTLALVALFLLLPLIVAFAAFLLR